MKTDLTLLDRTLTLHRFPKRSNETLQAWDAGDEYIINHVEEMNLEPGKHILIMNDSFGALSTWFSKDHDVTMMSDSFISHRGALKNLQRNQSNRVSFLNTMDAIPHGIDLVIMQLPKTNRHLIWQLSQLRQALPEGCQVIGVNKVKEIYNTMI